MLTMELQVEIEILYRQGKGVREIARETGLPRNTIRDILRGEHDGQYGPRKPRPTKLDEHKDYLRDRLEQAGAVRLNATVLLREIRSRGYDGGVTQLKEYLNAIRPQLPAEPITDTVDSSTIFGEAFNCHDYSSSMK